jgi:hypothetical protein
VQIGGEGLERADGLGIPVGGHGDIMLLGTAVDACGVRLDALDQGR